MNNVYFSKLNNELDLVDQNSNFKISIWFIVLVKFHLQSFINLICFLLNNLFDHLHLSTIYLIVCKWNSIYISSILSEFLIGVFLIFRSLLNFWDEKIISLIVKFSFQIFLEQMIIFKHQLSEFLVHHSLLLALYIFKCIRNNSNKNVKHNNNKENCCNHKNKIDNGEPYLSKLFRIKIS